MTSPAATHERSLGLPPTPQAAMPREIPLSVAWNFVVALASLYASFSIFGLSEFLNLGRPVQVFAGIVVLIPAVLALFSSVQLLRRQGSGRYIALIIQFIGLVFSVAGLLNVWGAFNSFEAMTDGLLANYPLLLGFAIAYAVFWIAGRLDENSETRSLLERAAGIIAAITLLALLLLSNALGAVGAVLSTYTQPSAWIYTICALIFGFLGWRMLHLGAYFGEMPGNRIAWQGWLMLSPNIIGFMFFFAGPLLLSFYLSFTNSTVGRTPEFIALQNYADIFSIEIQRQADLSQPPQSALSRGYTELGSIETGGERIVVGAKDRLFWLSLRNTLMFCLLLVPLAVIPALALSIVLNSKIPGMRFFRAIYFLPSIAAVVGTALIWRWLYDPTIGFYNYIISSVVTWLNATFGLSIQDPAIQWLTGPGVVLFSIVFLSAWQVVGYNTVLFLAGLQGIPGELYEAAQIDGANKWQQFWSVTLPLLGPTTFFVLITTIVTGLQVFNEPYALFPSRPIPENATTSVFYLYNRGFFRFEFGYASSIAWVLFALIFSITLLQFRIQRRNQYS